MGVWSVRDSSELYGISNWGDPYFSITSGGDVQVHPNGAENACINLPELVEDLRGRGLHTPLLIRFSDILASRVRELNACFVRAMDEFEYGGRYRGVYPIKVNQQRQVVEELVEFGAPYALGLEVGSKPELLVALALLETEGALLVCNGYKDPVYLEMALLAQKLGRYPVIVLDRPNELASLIKVSRELDVRPHIGIRARLAARGAGKWIESSGERSKFGLSASEIMLTLSHLRSEDMLDCLEMLHFHIGSQITDIRAHKEALREASRVFVGLCELGAAVRMFDVGGGLGVDYDGSQTNFHSSMNYSTQEYANDVVFAIAEACNERGIPHPDLVTEAGRALVSHSSVLVFDVLGVDSVVRGPTPSPTHPDEHRLICELYEVWSNLSVKNVLESYHDVMQLKEEATSLFNLGYFDLPARARVEELYGHCAQRILQVVRNMKYVPDDLIGLERSLADTYYGNFSVFQSLPDAWAMNQLFPVMPIQRLNERPSRRGIFADLTCDSDGKVDRFIDLRDVRDVLELHEPDGGLYTVGAFLVGAYQETLGEVHNLFGDTHTVHVCIEPGGGYRIEQLVEGDSVEEVLSYVQYDRRGLREQVQRSIEAALRRSAITLEEAALVRRRYRQELAGYTYLDPGS